MLEYFQHRIDIMKALLAVLVVGAMVCAGGCATPAYSARERGQLISRAWGYEWAQLQDDVDSILLLHPPSMMTLWDVR